MKRLHGGWLAAATAAVMGLAGCGGGGGGNTNPGVETTVRAALSGLQVVSAVTTTASGSASLTISAARDRITVKLDTVNLTNGTAARIRLGKVGATGEAMFTIYESSTPMPASVSNTATAATFTPVGSVTSFAQAITAILAGQAYLEVSTAANPNGEIRGQIGPVSLTATLTGVGGATGSGGATVVINDAQNRLTITLTSQALTKPISADLRAGSAGPTVFTFYNQTTDGALTSPFTKTLDATNLITGSGLNFDQALGYLIGGQGYVAVNTEGKPTGEIAGTLAAQ